MRFIRSVTLVAALFVCPAVFAAGSLRVAPTRLELAPARKAASLTVTNTGNAPVLLQLEVKHWSQAAGTDEYTNTEDIIVSPPIFTLDAGAEQVVRVGRRERDIVGQQRAYRLFIQEVPTPARQAAPELSVVLRIGVPLFITPEAASAADLQWDLECRNAASPVLRVQNRGGSAVRFDQLLVRAAETQHVERAVYVLAGATRVLPLTDTPASARHVELSASSGERELRSSASCP